MTHMRRYSEIVSVLVRYGFVDVVRALHLTPYLAAGRRVLTAAGRSEHPELSRPRRLRLACESLGPTFIKFGQALSTRADLMPPEVIEELALLQDSLPPLGPGVAEGAIEEAFARPVVELFAEFNPAPLATASIAQVHKATLHSGEVVAVKVRRPGIHALIEADIAILADLARLAERYLPDGKLFSLPELVDEFARTIRREQDFAREGRIIEREVVARRGADAVLRQILVHGLFHADPHPGNILVMPGNVVAFIDFGIVGRVNRQMRMRLANTILAIGRHDAERLADIVVALATPLQPVQMAELARDIEEMLDVYAGVSIGDLSMGQVFSSIMAAMSRHRLKLPADILLLIKSLSTIEGVGRQIDPSFKIVEHATPHVERLVAERHNARALAARTAGAGREVLSALRTLPGNLAEITRKARTEGLEIQFVHRNLDYFIREMDRSSNRLSFAAVIAAIVIGSSVMVHAAVGPLAFGLPVFGLAGFLTVGFLGIGLAVGILRSGRL